MTRLTSPANVSVDPVDALLDQFAGDHRAAVGALLDLVYRQHDEIDRLRESLSIANDATSWGYVRGRKAEVGCPQAEAECAQQASIR